MLSPKEGVLQWYIFASNCLHWDYSTISNTPLEDFLDIVVLYDKMQNPQDYQPVEDIFRKFM